MPHRVLMNSTEIIVLLECSLLAVSLLSILIAVIMYKRKTLRFSYNAGLDDFSLGSKYRISPQTRAKCTRQAGNTEQVINPDSENRETTNDCTMIDETIDTADSGRLYFSLKYEPKRCVLTVKLIKGENLPILSSDTSKAYVKVQMVSHKTFGNSATEVKKSVSTNYQKIYMFLLQPSEFVSSTIFFEISRFDRFSRKYDIGYVFIALAELQAQGVDLSREAFLTKDITCTYDSKIFQRSPKLLWNKLSHAVHAGFVEELRRNHNESLQWDPYLIVQRYEYSHSNTNQQAHLKDNPASCLNESPTQLESIAEEAPEWYPKVSNSSDNGNFTNSGAHSPPSIQKTTSLNTEFYHLVHLPSPRRRSSAEPFTSWSIPETYRFAPSPLPTQGHRVEFQSAPTPISPRRDRLQKLTSLSSSYREKILRKSRKRANSGRTRLAGKVPLHESLYLGKETEQTEPSTDERTFKRFRKK